MNSQRAIIFFLWKEGVKAQKISDRLKNVFGDAGFGRSAVFKWINRFKDGRDTLEDDPRSGRPSTSVNAQMISMVEEMVMKDRRVTIREISDQFGIGKRQVGEILHHLNLNKVCARWVPRLLNPLQKQNRVEVCQELLDLEQAYGANFWFRIITTDETWVPYFNPETKAQSMQWRRPDEGPPVKAKVVPSIGKVMLTVFWDCEGIICIDYLPKGATINAQYYSDLLKGPLRTALVKKRPGKLSAKPLLQQDNARPHTARLTMDTINDLGWELLPHPPYSPDLAPSDYHLFGEMKKPLRGVHFSNLDEIKHEIRKWQRVTPKEFFETGLKKMINRWNSCIALKGDYIEKCHIDESD